MIVKNRKEEEYEKRKGKVIESLDLNGDAEGKLAKQVQ